MKKMADFLRGLIKGLGRKHKPGAPSSASKIKSAEKTNDGGMSETHRSQHERVPSGESRDSLSNKINSIVLNYNPKYKINIHESPLIKIND